MTSRYPGRQGRPFQPLSRFELSPSWDGPEPETVPAPPGLATDSGFDALLTVDRGFAHQQSQDDLPLPVVIMLAASNRPDELRPLVPKAIGVLSGALQRRVYHVRAASP